MSKRKLTSQSNSPTVKCMKLSAFGFHTKSDLAKVSAKATAVSIDRDVCLVDQPSSTSSSCSNGSSETSDAILPIDNILTATNTPTKVPHADSSTNTPQKTAQIVLDSPTNTPQKTAQIVIGSPTNTPQKTTQIVIDSPTNTPQKATHTDNQTNTPQKLPAKDASTPTNTPTRVKRTFNDKWLLTNKWLRYDSNKKLMFCDVCIKAQVCNSFTIGCSVMKSESVTRHATNYKGNSSHSRALQLNKEAEQMNTARINVHTKSQDAVIAALRNTHFAAVNNLPNTTVPKLNTLCIEQGTTKLKDLRVDDHTTYEHHDSIRDFQNSIATWLDEKLMEKIMKSGIFSIMMDESTDVSVHQNLIIYIRILEEVGARWEPKSYFLGLRQLTGANADKITEEVLKVLEIWGLPVEKLVGVSTDGAAVMVGKKSGVVTRLKELVPQLLSTHCIAHRLALACCSAADKLVYMVKFQAVLNSLFSYFSNSPKNTCRLEAVQEVVKTAKSKLKQVSGTRWLSFEGSVSSVVKNYSSVLAVLLEDKSAKCLAMHKPMTSFKFLYVLHFLCDVLLQLANLSRMYQRADVDFSQVHPMLHSTVNVLEELRDKKSGTVISRFLKVVPEEVGEGETFEFDGHVIRDSTKQRSEAESACCKFVDRVVDGLKDRFSDDDDADVLSSLCTLFSPSLESEIGEEQMEAIGSFVSRCDVENSGSLGQEVIGFRAYVKAQANRGGATVKTVKDVAQLACQLTDVFPLIAILGMRLLAIPVSSVECERGFSRQNLIKTENRNRLDAPGLQTLLRISLASDVIIDYDAVFNIWSSKPRRILQNKK